MKVCGVDLKGNEAIVSLVSLADGLFHCQIAVRAVLTACRYQCKGAKELPKYLC